MYHLLWNNDRQIGFVWINQVYILIIESQEYLNDKKKLTDTGGFLKFIEDNDHMIGLV